MKRLRSSLRRLPLLAACAPLLSACGSDPVAPPKDSLPSAKIEVTRDRSGVPHISAQNDRDAFFGAGYMMASDRLLQMDMARRRALGRWAEVLGEARREDDQLARLFNWRDAGKAFAERTKQDNPDEWSLITAWVAGVNRRIDEVLAGKAPLPEGFGPDALNYQPERWSEEDPLVIAKMTGFGNDLSLDFELFATLAQRLKPAAFGAIDLFRPARDVFTVPPEDLPAGVSPPGGMGGAPPPPEPASAQGTEDAAIRAVHWLARLHSLRSMGSNNWAIDGRFTSTKMPLIAGDPHLGFDFPGMLYALHIDSTPGGGSFNVAGFSLPALPGVSLGHTDRVAWSATTAFGDVMDVWEAPLLDDQDKIVLGGQEVSFVRRTEQITVRRQSDPVTIEVAEVPGQGVLLPDDIAPLPLAKPGNTLFMRWTGYDPNKVSHLVGLDRARTIDDFDAAVDLQSGLNFNMVAADAHGITYRVGLDVPVRDVAGGQKPWLLMDGTDAKSLWTGALVPRDHLPRGRAKQRGWLVTANNDPFGFTENGRLDDDPYYYGALFDPAFRASRISGRVEDLTKKGGVTPEDMMALQTDIHDMMAEDLLPMLKDAWSKVGKDPALADFVGRDDMATLVDLLENKWDGRMARDSAGAAVFFAFSHLAVAEAIQDDFGLLYYPAFNLEPIFLLKLGLLVIRGDYPNGASVLQEGRDKTVLNGLAKTADYLKSRFGTVDPSKYTYADLHSTLFKDSLGAGVDYGSAPSDGGEANVNVSPSVFLRRKRHRQTVAFFLRSHRPHGDHVHRRRHAGAPLCVPARQHRRSEGAARQGPAAGLAGWKVSEDAFHEGRDHGRRGVDDRDRAVNWGDPGRGALACLDVAAFGLHSSCKKPWPQPSTSSISRRTSPL
jgi:penicillin amidase